MYKSYNDNITSNIEQAQYIKKLIETQVDSIIYDRYIKDNDRIIKFSKNILPDLYKNNKNVKEDKKNIKLRIIMKSYNYLTSRTNCLGKI